MYTNQKLLAVAVLMLLVPMTLLLPYRAVATPPDQAMRIAGLEMRLAELEAAAGAPSKISYQGYLADSGGNPINGPVTLKFGVYDSTPSGLLWQEILTDTVNGYFSVILGEQTPLNASIFSQPDRWLQVSVKDGDSYTDLPRQQIASVPYALQAASAPWSGLSGVPAGFADGVDNEATYTAGDGLILNGQQFSMLGTSYDNVIIVAKSGGDYQTIQAAIDSISDSSATNPYLIWVGPGVYSEQVTLNKPNIFIQGSGVGTTVIEYNTAGADPASAAVVKITDDGDSCIIRDMTIQHTASSGTSAVGVYTAGRYVSLLSVYINLGQTGATTIYGVYNTGGDAAAQGQEIGIQHGAAGTSCSWSTQLGADSRLKRSNLTGGDVGLCTSGTNSKVDFHAGVVSGGTNTIDNGAGCTTRVMLSQLSGGATQNSGALTCVGVYDETNTWSDNTCP